MLAPTTSEQPTALATHAARETIKPQDTSLATPRDSPGLCYNDGVFFEVIRPTAPEIPVVVEVPHAGITLDPESLALCTAPARSLGRDADLFVDELYAGAPALGATLVVAHASRYACDLNRAEEDLDSQTSPAGSASNSPFGVVWRRTTLGRPAISAPLDPAEIERRLSLIYRPYHAALEAALAETQSRFGHVILLCGHSMPSFGRLGDRRADLVPGSRGGSTCNATYLRALEGLASEFSLDFAHDAPYRGGFTTGFHGRPKQGRHAVQLELARRLYMDETTLARDRTLFSRTTDFCGQLVARFGELSPN